MGWWLLILAISSGAVAPLQIGINSQLAKTLLHPLQAVLVSFVIGTFGVIALSYAFRVPLPAVMQPLKTPPILLTGGLLGAYMVMSSITAAPRLGAAVFIAASIAGQMMASLLLDHYGIMGYAVQPISAVKVLGVVFVCAGVMLIRGF